MSQTLPTTNALQSRRPKISWRLGGLLVVLVLVGVGAFWFFVLRDRDVSSSVFDESKRVVAGVTVPLSDCETTKPKTKEDTFGDLCYETQMTIGGEQVTYIIVAQSEEDLVRAQDACTIDCGFDAGGPARSDFIIRANGSVEVAPEDTSALTAFVTIEPLTGCSDTSQTNDETAAQTGTKLVKVGKRIGLYRKVANEKYADPYGNSCVISFESTEFATKPYTQIKSLRVHYDIQDPSTCAGMAKAEAEAEACFTNQAALRKDVTFCQQTSDRKVECITGVATRMLDANICDQIQDKYCKNQVAESAQELVGQIEVY